MQAERTRSRSEQKPASRVSWARSASHGAWRVASRILAGNRPANAAQPLTHGLPEPGSRQQSAPSLPPTSAAGGQDPSAASTRRNSPFASSLTSNIRIARSPLPQANQALLGQPLKKGDRAPL